MTTYQEFIAREKLTMTASRVKANPNMDADNMHHWLCLIAVRGETRENYMWPVYFSMGFGLKGAPELAQVLECLASDAAGYENARDFEDWAETYGYDTDSRKAEQTYNTIWEQITAMQDYLGTDAYEDLLWEVSDEEAA